MQTFFLDMKDGVPLRDGGGPDTHQMGHFDCICWVCLDGTRGIRRRIGSIGID